MKTWFLALLMLALLLCPLAATADGLTAELVQNGDEKAVLFTDEQGDTYLLLISDDGVQVVTISRAEDAQDSVPSAPQGSAPSGEACWRCGGDLAVGDHTSGYCGYKYHSACMDAYFSRPEDHVKCPICGSCMCSSGSSHGIGYSKCGADLLDEKCATCGLAYKDSKAHGGKLEIDKDCKVHCWLSRTHQRCALCSRALCNGEKHADGVCNKLAN